MMRFGTVDGGAWTWLLVTWHRLLQFVYGIDRVGGFSWHDVGDDGGGAAVNPKMVCGDGNQSVDHASLDTVHTAACRLVNTCVTYADDAVRHS